MELLIFLSAILTALTGVAGGARAAEPQRVASSGIAVTRAVEAERRAVVRVSLPAAEVAALIVLTPLMPAMIAQPMPRLAALQWTGRRHE